MTNRLGDSYDPNSIETLGKKLLGTTVKNREGEPIGHVCEVRADGSSLGATIRCLDGSGNGMDTELTLPRKLLMDLVPREIRLDVIGLTMRRHVEAVLSERRGEPAVESGIPGWAQSLLGDLTKELGARLMAARARAAKGDYLEAAKLHAEAKGMGDAGRIVLERLTEAYPDLENETISFHV